MFARSVASSWDPDLPEVSFQPRPGFFGVLYKGLTSLRILQPVFSNIITIWRWVYPQHLKNTQRAQQELDREYHEYHNEEWALKNDKATSKMMVKLAKEQPFMFARGYIMGEEQGSLRRRTMVGFLKKMNPQYYDENSQILGEAVEWADILSQARDMDTEEDAMYTYSDIELEESGLLKTRSQWND
jgi:hypothetical protein